VVKRPLEHLRGDAQVAASLRREARIGGQLRHPNLVAILDAGVHDGYDYLVLEYVHGAALRTVMLGDAPGQVRELPLGVVLAVISDAARGMHEAHELTDERGSSLGLVHRDVSPGNILLGLDGTVKLADFGIAKETRVSTLSGSMHGTVTYMAPEQCQGHAYDRRADVFSLGVILYELVTATRLFWADNDVASLHRVLSGAVPRPRAVKPQIASALEDIVMTAVAHAAEQRFATALDLATAVEAYAASSGEVLGARWIARCVEEIVGPKPVPWIAATPAGGTPAVAPAVAPHAGAPPASTAPSVQTSGDISLVDLIAGLGSDEPGEPGFGDGDAFDESEAASPRAPSAPPRAPSAPMAAQRSAPRAPSAPTIAQGSPSGAQSAPAVAQAGIAAPRRHSGARVALIVIAGAIVGGAAAALVTMRGSEPPAAISAPAANGSPASISAPAANGSPPASISAPAANDSPPASISAPAANDSPPASISAPAANASPPAPSSAQAPSATPPTADSPPAASASPPVPSSVPAAPATSTSPTMTDAVVAPTPRERPGRRAPASAAPSREGGDRAATAKRKRPPSKPAPEPSAPVATEPARPETPPTPAAGSAAPPAPAPTNVEWKPTLLLPTDKSDGKPHQ
jgi:serine/threonine-protein kinase